MVLFALLGSRQVDPTTVAVLAGLLVVVGMSWAVWVGSRLRRRTIAQSTEGNPASSRAASTAAVTRQAIAARRVAISVLVLAVAVLVGTLTATAGTADRLALRDAVERPIDPAAFASPLSVFRTYTKEQADVVQLIATGMPDGARLRLAALDCLRRPAVHRQRRRGTVRPDRPERDVPAVGVPITVTVNIRNYAGPFLPLPGPIIALDFAGDRAAQLTAGSAVFRCRGDRSDARRLADR